MRLKSRPASFDRLTVVPILALCWTTAHPQPTALTEGQVAQNATVVGQALGNTKWKEQEL